ncbi:MAG: TAXI family TRAP transporter solute-binding subunit [Deferribacteraceae bacterium]|jgi:TRAP transporter TAXI family solute receptor|nr:TAXI family TRAP transporter solute-binding subunit [Deferribacteraceae bacterium]
MKKNILVILTALMFAVLGCEKKTETAADGAAPAEQRKTSVTIGTAGTAGTYYVVAAAMAQAINNNSEFLNVTVQSTKGSVENLNLTSAGEIELGFSNADGVYWATTGTGTYEGKPQNVSNVMSLYLSCGQMATLKKSGITSYGDLKGKRVCLGPPATTIVEMSKAILRAYGIDPEKDIKPYYLAFDEGLAELMDGTIDATFFVAAAPTAAMVNACSTGDIHLVDVPEDILAKVSAENPYFTPYVIPNGTSGGLEGDVHTLKIMTEIFANNDVPEDVIYDFVKQALENTDEYVASHVAAQEIIPTTAASSISKYHPGAEKYYREKGLIQ